MKVAIIGAGNVGSLTAMRLAQEGLDEVLLIDIVKGLAKGKSLDLEDARDIVKQNYRVTGSDDMSSVKGCDIVVITAGLPRKPGMTREELLAKNASIIKDVCANIKKHAPSSIVIVVTNPLDLMTRYALDVLKFNPQRVFGMGISLDAARFANLISAELKVSPVDIDACVIGSHGEGMLPLPRFTNIKGVSLEEFISGEKIGELVKRTVNRGAEIVALLGSGSAFFAPSAAIAAMVKVIAKDEKRTIGASVYAKGEYGISGVCIGLPCRLGRKGVEEIIELELNKEEKKALLEAAERLKEQYKTLSV